MWRVGWRCVSPPSSGREEAEEERGTLSPFTNYGGCSRYLNDPVTSLDVPSSRTPRVIARACSLKESRRGMKLSWLWLGVVPDVHSYFRVRGDIAVFYASYHAIQSFDYHVLIPKFVGYKVSEMP